jgi:hypothetical protein
MNRKYQVVQESFALHPLDEKVDSGFDIQMPKNNYYRQVHSNLSHIIESEEGISEKDHQGVQTVMENVDKLLRTLEAQRVVERFETGKFRPQYCAECLYSKIKK